VTLLVIALVAAGASALTFFSGFGLGTLLLPAFALFYPIDVAIASTAVVHFLNGLFKLTLVGSKANRRVVLLFGLPALAAAFLGARLLIHLADLPPLTTYTLGGRHIEVGAAKFIIGVLLMCFTLLELSPRLGKISFAPKWLPVGGVLSGFFGGLSGMQGALRSAFLIRAGLSKEAFIGTGVVIACLIDVARLTEYVPNIMKAHGNLDYVMLGTAVLAAFAGALVGNRYLKKMTLERIQRLVAIMLLLVALGLMSGVL
jgi:uncharacterized membrane protein YfcA